MSGNYTFEKSNFADLRFSFVAARVPRSLQRCSYGVNYCETNDFVFFYQRVCVLNQYYLKDVFYVARI